MFVPPHCPHPNCSQYKNPQPKFCIPHGSYRPKCRSHPVPRFKCRGCGRTFSRQTFRMDYHDHRPHLNARLFELIAAGVGIRKSSRLICLTQRCTEIKLRKISRHLRHLNLNVRTDLPKDATLHFDELESYEHQRNTRPLTIPLLIESKSRFIIWATSSTIRPRGKMSPGRLKAIARADQRYGVRKDRSREGIRRTLKRGADLAKHLEVVQLDTDEKSTYPGLAAEAFGTDRLDQRKTNSKLARGTFNPLFPINHEEAVMRYLTGRLRRKSWLVSKKKRFLNICLHLYMADRNLVRIRFNHDSESPAQMLGFAPRKFTKGEVLSWRQDFGGRSIHPMASGSMSVEAHMARSSRARQAA